MQCERIAKEVAKKVAQQQMKIPATEETRAQMNLALLASAERAGDDRMAVEARSLMYNQLKATEAPFEIHQLLSVTEVLERHGIKVPKGKDSALGRKVAARWRAEFSEDPQSCEKAVGTGHRTADIKVYPEEFFERIVTIAQEYLG